MRYEIRSGMSVDSRGIEWVIEVDDDGAAVLCAETEPVFAAASLAQLLDIVGVEANDVLPLGY
jgi:hypothetical protein